MSESQRLERILDQAKENEKKYDWIEAAKIFEQALGTVGKMDFLRKAEIQEKVGHCFYRAAFQAETQDEFRSYMLEAVEAYEKATELYENVEGLEKQAEVMRCRAKATYCNSRLATDLSKKSEQLEECWKLGKQALKAFEEKKDHVNLGKVCNDLMVFLNDCLLIEWEASSREKIIGEALEYGKGAIEAFSRAGDKHQLAQAYNLTGSFYRNAVFARGFRVERREECREKALSYPEKAREISEEIVDAYLIGMSNSLLAKAHLDILGKTGNQERQYYEKALQLGMLTRDKFCIASALWGLEFVAGWHAIAQEDPDKAREEYRKLDRYGEAAVHHYSLVNHNSGIAMAYSLMLYPIRERSRMEINLKNRHLLIEKYVKLGYKGLQYARLSGSIGCMFHMTRTLGRALVSLAKVETDTVRKKGLLEESSKHIEESINVLRQASGCSHVEPREATLGGCLWALAANQAELANMEKVIDEKAKMLRNAVANMRSARESWMKWSRSPSGVLEKPHFYLLAENEMKTGEMLNQLYVLTCDVDVLGDAVEAFEESVTMYGEADSVFSRVAESYWQLAKAYHNMENYSASAKNFKLASENYILASKKIPQLKNFYQDYASYMRAWSEIEKARHLHAERQYELAREHYEKAADLHKTTERWNYLRPNYLAWAQLEEAEDLSRREHTEEARISFQQAAELFVEAKKSFKAKLERIEVKEEKMMAVELIKASDIRREYCLGRIALEEAKALDRRGDHVMSSKKYKSAAEMFQKIAEAESEQSRRELKPIICLCQAWQKMMMGEAKASSSMYGEASVLFQRAREHSLDQPTSLLASANSSFCKALQAGTEFEITSEMAKYSTAKKHMEAAEKYYLKAGVESASEYAKATCLLFDAYMYTHKAEIETDPRRKAQYYQMAERVLQASAGSYIKAKHPEKSEEVHRLLESVKEKRQLAVSLSRILHAPAIASTTASFSTPTPTHEQAIGLERFEHADIQANLILRAKDVKVGEDVDFRMELVNAGKAPALLIKVDEIVPEGFEIKQVAELYTVEDSRLNMKGKRLNPLKTEDVKMVINPRFKGTFIVKPRVLYIDETGKYKSHEPEPITIIVKELGIKGWIKGER